MWKRARRAGVKIEAEEKEAHEAQLQEPSQHLSRLEDTQTYPRAAYHPQYLPVSDKTQLQP